MILSYYGHSNKRPGSFIKSEKDFHPGCFLFQAAWKMTAVPWNQNNNDRSGILNRFIDQENLQMYAQMDWILFCHWNNTHSILLTNGKIHYVIFNCVVLVYDHLYKYAPVICAHPPRPIHNSHILPSPPQPHNIYSREKTEKPYFKDH